MTALAVLRLGLVGLVALALGFFAYGIASAPSRVASRLGLRGLKRQRAVAEGGVWSQIEPVVRWLGVRVSGLVPDKLHAHVDRRLVAAGDYVGLTPDEFVALSLLSAIGFGTVGGIAGNFLELGPLFWTLAPPLGAILPYLQVSSVAQQRMLQIEHGLPGATDLMALSMGAGLDFPGAMRQVVEKASDPDDALIEELRLMLHLMKLGHTRKEVLNQFRERSPLDSVIQFSSSLIQAEERGNPIADVLQIQATVARNRRSTKAEEQAARAGVAMVAPLFLLFGAILLMVLAPVLMSLSL